MKVTPRDRLVHLIVCDIFDDEEALMDQFRLRRMMWQLFLWQMLWSSTRLEKIYASVVVLLSFRTMWTPMLNITSDITPMEIDTTYRREAFVKVEKQRRWANHLCLYCGGLRHILIISPYQLKCQVSQLRTNSKANIDSPITSRNTNSPTPSNRFESH